ncbi:MAG: pentapeptide repeat-containing protein [Pseudomonadota bacterium]
MPESLLGGSSVVLVGDTISDLSITGATENQAGPWPTKNTFVGSLLKYNKVSNSKKDEPTFARVYGFVYVGAYYELDVPALFLVHGSGTPVENHKLTNKLAAQDFTFSKNLLAWDHDQSDFSIRLDVQVGPLDEILLDPDGSAGPSVAGARVSGARVSGARVSGARVSGARVSGARVSGARVSGARLSGD